jgi:osmotically-inducible protein OsmY
VYVVYCEVLARYDQGKPESVIEVDDESLRREIFDTISEDTRVDEKEVTLRVRDGVVYLDGAVDSAAERRAIYEDIEMCAGVRSVVDNLTLTNFIACDDETLSQSVKLELLRDPTLDARNIEVHADNGRIRLEGRVATYSEKRTAESTAWWAPGVIDVTSRLCVDDRAPANE